MNTKERLDEIYNRLQAKGHMSYTEDQLHLIARGLLAERDDLEFRANQQKMQIDRLRDVMREHNAALCKMYYLAKDEMDRAERAGGTKSLLGEEQ